MKVTADLRGRVDLDRTACWCCGARRIAGSTCAEHAGRLHPGVALDPAQTVHTLPAMLRFRMFANTCGFEVADDCDALRGDPAVQGRTSAGLQGEAGSDLCSQLLTLSRPENVPSRTELGRLTCRPGRHLLPKLSVSAGDDHGRHRRHLRSGARPAAAVAVRRLPRHAVLPGGARLPGGERHAGGGPPAPRKDAVRCRGPHPSHVI